MEMSFLARKYDHIFVDFDSTLYLWDNTSRRESFPSDIEWNAMCLLGNHRDYKEDYINEDLVNYLLKQITSEIHLMSHVSFSFEAWDKYKFINNYYPGLLSDWIGVSSPETKVDVLNYYEGAGVPRSQILLIDNDPDVVSMCRSEGFDVQEPQFVMSCKEVR